MVIPQTRTRTTLVLLGISIVLALSPSLAKAGASLGSLTQVASPNGCVVDSSSISQCQPLTKLDAAWYPTQWNDLAVSPEGSNVYLSSETGIVAFARNATTGALTELAGASGCLNGEGGASNCTKLRGLTNVSDGQITVSPDGLTVYLASGSAILSFSRSPSTGALTQLAGAAGCMNQDGSESCTEDHSAASFVPQWVKVAPDGHSAYAGAGPNENGAPVWVFSRDTSSGALTRLSGAAGCISSDGADGGGGTCTEVAELDNGSDIAIAPDGTHAYVVSPFFDAIVGFSRNSTTGALTPLSGTTQCIVDEPGYKPSELPNCLAGRSLANLERATVTPDGRNLYVTAGSGGLENAGVAEFSIDAVSGALTQAAGTAGCLTVSGNDGEAPSHACATAAVTGGGGDLGDAREIVASPDGGNVYVDGESNGDVVALTRSPAGVLSDSGCIGDNGNGATCSPAVQTAGLDSVALSPDGSDVYAATDNGLAAFARLNQHVISSLGPLSDIFLNSDLSCQVLHGDDPSNAFYGGIDPGACATFLATNGTLYGHPINSLPQPEIDFIPVNQSEVTGNSTSGTPLQVASTVAAVDRKGEIVALLVQSDTYVLGEESYTTTVQVQNVGKSTLNATLYHLARCHIKGQEENLGITDGHGGVFCSANGEAIPAEGFVPGADSPGSHYLEGEDGYFFEYVDAAGDQLGDAAGLCSICEPPGEADAAGLSWPLSVPTGQSVTRSFSTKVDEDYSQPAILREAYPPVVSVYEDGTEASLSVGATPNDPSIAAKLEYGIKSVEEHVLSAGTVGKSAYPLLYRGLDSRLSGLTPDRTYQVKVTFSNASGSDTWSGTFLSALPPSFTGHLGQPTATTSSLGGTSLPIDPGGAETTITGSWDSGGGQSGNFPTQTVPGNAPATIAEPGLASLQPATQYNLHFTLTNSIGSTTTSLSVTTLPALTPPPPGGSPVTLTTGSAENVTAKAADLFGGLYDPQGATPYNCPQGSANRETNLDVDRKEFYIDVAGGAAALSSGALFHPATFDVVDARTFTAGASATGLSPATRYRYAAQWGLGGATPYGAVRTFTTSSVEVAGGSKGAKTGILLSGGSIGVTLACEVTKACSGVGLIYQYTPLKSQAGAIAKAGKASLLGSGSFHIRARSKGRLPLKLTAAGRRYVRRHSRSNFELKIVTPVAGHPVTSSVPLFVHH